MERWIFGVIATLGLAVASPAATAGDDWMATCKSVSKMAEAIMKGRQAGGSMADMMAVDTGNETVTQMGRLLVMQAFKQPRFDSEEYQHKAVVDFSNNAYSMCASRLSQ